MKICYVDESGNNPEDPCLVMVGVVVDAYRLNRTREEFADIFDEIQTLFEENLRELKGSKMIFGRDRWRKVDPEVRKRIAGYLCDWIADRKHHIALAAVVDDDRLALADDVVVPPPHRRLDGFAHSGHMFEAMMVLPRLVRPGTTQRPYRGRRGMKDIDVELFGDAPRTPCVGIGGKSLVHHR